MGSARGPASRHDRPRQIERCAMNCSKLDINLAPSQSITARPATTVDTCLAEHCRHRGRARKRQQCMQTEPPILLLTPENQAVARPPKSGPGGCWTPPRRVTSWLGEVVFSIHQVGSWTGKVGRPPVVMLKNLPAVHVRVTYNSPASKFLSPLCGSNAKFSACAFFSTYVFNCQEDCQGQTRKQFDVSLPRLQQHNVS